MQHRMKTYQLTTEQINQLLAQAQTGCLATVNPDGSPYVTPVHFVYDSDMIYIHGLPKGQKVDNIRTNPQVGMTVFQMEGYLLDAEDKPCDTNTKYQSVIVSGEARLLEDMGKKEEVLRKIIKKYTPHLGDRQIPDTMQKGTAVIAICVQSITGKYYG